MEAKDVLIFKLTRYLSNENSKEDIYFWAIDILHNMLKGEIFELKNLELFGFIVDLTGINELNEQSCKKLIRNMLKILLGEECTTFSFFMKIPKKFINTGCSRVREILEKYSVEKGLSKAEMQEIKKFSCKKTYKPKTLNEFIENQLIIFLDAVYEFRSDENDMQFNVKHTVFIDEELSCVLEEDVLQKCRRMLECYEGDRCFCVHIAFYDGVGRVSIQI